MTHSFPTRRSSDLTNMLCSIGKVKYQEVRAFTKQETQRRTYLTSQYSSSKSSMRTIWEKIKTLWPSRSNFGSSLRSEEHTSELQSLMRISYAVFCLKKKNNQRNL